MKNAFMSKSEQYQTPQPQAFPSINTSDLMTTMIPPKVEPMVEDSFNINHNMNSETNLMDLLAQIQAIKLMNEASNCANHKTITSQFLNEGTMSSPSSSSSTCSTAAQDQKSKDFSWQDFLLEDALLSANPQVQDSTLEFSSKDFPNNSHYVTPRSQINIENNIQIHNGVKRMDFGGPIYGFPASSSTDSSFVEAMIHRQNEMFLDFPDLLEEPFYN
ncbi:hypothetical protein Pint_15312 [Pistacia integerrima]|uniref:Uncharacterized protein n=1 Tax=Pistacia integerrima TaxID=434235 RepID=A0ACC0ZE26_9ROSI|nr:hypothetical protein Pint_15312 [Pistacia integerrima]